MSIADELRRDAEAALKEDGMYYSGEYLDGIAKRVEEVEAENAKLCEIIGELFDDLLFSCGECWLSGDVRTCDNEACDNYKIYQKMCALGIEAKND